MRICQTPPAGVDFMTDLSYTEHEKQEVIKVTMGLATAIVSREQLKGIFDTDMLNAPEYKITITPVTEAEAQDIEFKSLKGIAGRALTLDEVRKERLKL